ncbi:MAG: glycosyltransferase family 2 protein [Deltaproteobacteria bacterium]|nr:glycosyltransferase family 2 protein [Deltaproteobacteria bacterium]
MRDSASEKSPTDKISVSVIIPAYNEAETIGEIVKALMAMYPNFEIIVVNDGSTDDTGIKARDAGAIVYSHPYNIGNGAAIKSGIRIASGDILVFMDGDGQHDPKEIEALLAYFPDYDMVVGARGKGYQASWWRALANTIYNRFASYVAKFPIQDLTSGFRAVKAGLANNLLYLLPNTYSYPTTLTLSVLRTGRSLKYVPVNTKTRRQGKSKIKIFRDGLRFFLIITKICALYSPLRVFLPVSVFLFATGLGYYLYTYTINSRFTNMSALLFTTSVTIFMIGLVSEQISQMRFERSEGDKFV